MNKPTLNPYWIGFYFGKNIILHPDTGRWNLVGYFNGQIVCQRNIGTPDEDCMLYDISEIQFVLKKINPFLFKSVSDMYDFIKVKSSEGYWVFEDKSINVIFEQ